MRLCAFLILLHPSVPFLVPVPSILPAGFSSSRAAERRLLRPPKCSSEPSEADDEGAGLEDWRSFRAKLVKRERGELQDGGDDGAMEAGNWVYDSRKVNAYAFFKALFVFLCFFLVPDDESLAS